MTRIYFLAAPKPLTKKFTLLSDGTIQKTSYLNAFEVTSHVEEIDNITQFFAAIKQHADAGHCMVKGTLTRDLVNESRKGSTDGAATTKWVCFDIDGLPPTYSVDELMDQMGLGDTSYILQWSASQNIGGNANLRCHVMMLLRDEASAPLLKQWLVQLNHTVQFLRSNLGLTKTGMSLTWGLDITACQNDKLIYIAPPILEGVKNPLGRRLRYELIKKSSDYLALPTDIYSVDENRKHTVDMITSLRVHAKLPARKFTTRQYKSTEVLTKPDEATITGINRDRGFVYFNFNGGDSWAYYHPEDDCEIIYNFKGEPNYATKELLPEYYAQAKAEAATNSRAETSVGAFVVADKQPVLLAFRDAASGAYKHGRYEPTTDTLLLNDARNEKQVRDFCMQNSMPMGDFVPIWDMVFEPNNPVRIDIEARKINMFQRSQYMLAPERKVAKPPKTIHKIVSHMLAQDAQAIAHLYNWCAFVVQRRARPATAWVWYGVEGTGKGMFANKVLRRLIGMGQTTIRRGGELAEPYNSYMKNNLLVFFDEAHIAEMKDAESIMGKLRNFITEPTVSLRMMHSNPVEIENFAGIVCMSNKPNVVLLQKKDRRWNIGPFQHLKLELSEEEVTKTIESELQDFYDFLASYPLDETAARTPLVSEDRDRLIGTTTSSADEVAAALDARRGNFEFFLDQLPTNLPKEVNSLLTGKVTEYRATLKTLLERGIADGTGRTKISRDELHTLFQYTVGNMPESPNKFTKFLAHRHIHTEKVRIDKPVYGVQVMFADAPRFADYIKEFFSEPAPRTGKPALPDKKVKK